MLSSTGTLALSSANSKVYKFSMYILLYKYNINYPPRSIMYIALFSLVSAHSGKLEQGYIRLGKGTRSLIQTNPNCIKKYKIFTGDAGIRTKSSENCQQLCKHLHKCRAVWNSESRKCNLFDTKYYNKQFFESSRQQRRCNGRFSNRFAISSRHISEYLDAMRICGTDKEALAVDKLEEIEIECKQEKTQEWYIGTGPKPAVNFIKSSVTNQRPQWSIQLPIETHRHPSEHCSHFCRYTDNCSHWNYIQHKSARFGECHLMTRHKDIPLENCSDCKRPCPKNTHQCFNGTN